MWSRESFVDAVRKHDAAVAKRGVEVWVGSEPTFTDRLDLGAEWQSTALGGGKEARAQTLSCELWRQMAGSVMLRSLGRRYPGEDEPRWNFGLYRRRDGVRIWDGPLDPMLAPDANQYTTALDVWAAALVDAFVACGWTARTTLAPDSLAHRVSLWIEADATESLDFDLHAPSSGACIDLPHIHEVSACQAILGCIAQSAQACGLPTLVIGGESPPVDDTVELTTITPDPAVIEINTAPSANATEFLQRSLVIYAAATLEGLSPYRLYFNGAIADSGGGGQITLGGRSPLASPFVSEPRLLSRLVRFLNRHPSLSYLYSHDFVGSSGQSARADERGTSAVDELVLALDLLDREPNPTPELQWKTLAPFLCDASGNNHRAEINIEKLWNPFLPGRGQMGLVEFRALRMQHTPERATALACLLRALAAMLATAPYELPLIDWGRELHQRFALPFYLEQDLQAVLDALAKAGLGLDPAIEDVLRREEFRRWADVSLPGSTLELRRALEFWPLLGDAASPEQGGTSRLVDSSTKRVELRLRPDDDDVAGDWREWEASVRGVVLPWRSEHDEHGELRVYALRYRSFAPFAGLHPSLGAQTPIKLALRHPTRGLERTIVLHEWKPGNEPYPGLPDDLADAAARRSERIEVLEGMPDQSTMADDESRQRQIARGLGEYCFDLRYLG